MSFLTAALGGALSGAGNSLNGGGGGGGGALNPLGFLNTAAQALQPGPSNASRASADYNPVTVINAPGIPSLSGIGELIAQINASGQKAQTNNLAYQLATGVDPGTQISGVNWTLIILAGVGLVGVALWLRFK